MSSPDHLAAGLAVEPTSATAELAGLLREFVRLSADRTQAQTALDDANRRIGEITTQVIDIMITEGIDTLPGVDGMTVYTAPKYWVVRRKDPDTGEDYGPEAVAEALEAAGHGYLIAQSVNGNKLRALLREYREAESELPEPLARVVTLERGFDLRARPMGAAKTRASPLR